MKIAIVGGGISGLSAAYWLGPTHEVTLFEADPRLGGHACTVEVDDPQGPLAIDVGFIVYNERNYPRFSRLLDDWGVASQPTEMSLSVRCPRTGLEYCGSNLNTLFAQRRNLLRPAFWRMVRDILRFHREGSAAAEAIRVDPTGRPPAAWAGIDAEEPTVADFLAAGRYGREFVEHYLLPMGAAIWSCPPGTFAKFPVRFILEFYRAHGLLSLTDRPQWRTVTGGSRQYVEAVRSRLRGVVHLEARVVAIRREADRVDVTPAGSVPLSFDHVVLACHSDQALAILDDATPLERAVLSSFPYAANEAALHTDVSLLPRRRRAWASWNYRLSDDPAGRPAVTYCMNILQRLTSRTTYNVTLNGGDAIDPRRVIRRFQFSHPVFNVRRRAAQARHEELIGVHRTSFCGAYWGNGFHEDGAASAWRVARRLNGEPVEPRGAAPSIGSRSPDLALAACDDEGVTRVAVA